MAFSLTCWHGEGMISAWVCCGNYKTAKQSSAENSAEKGFRQAIIVNIQNSKHNWTSSCRFFETFIPDQFIVAAESYFKENSTVNDKKVTKLYLAIIRCSIFTIYYTVTLSDLLIIPLILRVLLPDSTSRGRCGSAINSQWLTFSKTSLNSSNYGLS